MSLDGAIAAASPPSTWAVARAVPPPGTVAARRSVMPGLAAVTYDSCHVRSSSDASAV